MTHKINLVGHAMNNVVREKKNKVELHRFDSLLD